MRPVAWLDHKPLLAESGGRMVNAGYATIICGPEGESLRRVVVHPPFQLMPAYHAYFVAEVGQHIIQYVWDNKGQALTIQEVIEVGHTIKTKTILEFEGPGMLPIPDAFSLACYSAREKARCPKCNHSHYSE